MVILEDRAVADDGQRRQPVPQALAPARGRRPRCRLRARRPVASASASTPRRVTHQRREFVEQRHRQGAPLDDEFIAHRPGARRPSAGSRSRSTPVSSSRPPLRYSGRPVSASRPCTRHTGPFEGFQQRVGQPLRQLVERHPALGQAGRRRTAGVSASSRRAADRRSRCPPARYPTATSAAATGCRGRRYRGGRRRPARRTGRPGARACRTPRVVGQHLPSRRSSCTRPSRPTSGLAGRTWNASARRSAVRRAQAGRVDLQRVGRVAGEQPGREGMPAGHAQPFRAGETLSLAASW